MASRPERLANTIAETIARTGIGRTKIFEAIRLGHLVAVKHGRRTLIREHDLLAFIESLPTARPDRAA